MGLVIVLLTASVRGYDLLADPIGWLLVLVGLPTLPVPQRGALQGLATLSLAVSAVAVVPRQPGTPSTSRTSRWPGPPACPS